MQTQTFVFIHDQDVLVKYIESNKFKQFENLKYVFVGNKPIYKIDKIENVVIARNLEINIEIYPFFTSFTGWYALWRNNFINADYINFFEYDVIILDESVFAKQEKLQEYDFIGYIPRLVEHFNYIKNHEVTAGIIQAIKKHYNLDMNFIINELLKKDAKCYWSSTSNSTFSRHIFFEYMEWFDKLIGDIKNSKFCGHAFERSLSFFCFVKNKKVLFLPGAIEHLQLNSHNTQPHKVDFEESIQKLISSKNQLKKREQQ